MRIFAVAAMASSSLVFSATAEMHMGHAAGNETGQDNEARKLQETEGGIDICGSTCQGVLSALRRGGCDWTWAMGCGPAVAPPADFTPETEIRELCPDFCNAAENSPQEQTGYTEFKHPDTGYSGICRAADGSSLNGRIRGEVPHEYQCADFCTALDGSDYTAECQAYTWLWLGPPAALMQNVCVLYGPHTDYWGNAEWPGSSMTTNTGGAPTAEWQGTPNEATVVGSTNNAYDAVCRVKNEIPKDEDPPCVECDGDNKRALLFAKMPCCKA